MFSYSRSGLLQADREFQGGDKLSPPSWPAWTRVCFSSADEWIAFFSALYFTANETSEFQIQAIEEASQQWRTGCMICETCETLEAIVEDASGTVEGLLAAFVWHAVNCCPESETDWQTAIDGLEWPEWCTGGNMIGDIVFSAAGQRQNSLRCNGAEYFRVDYPDLYAALDSVYITGPDTFVVPDVRSRTLVGAGQGPGLTNRLANDELGEETHQLTLAELAEHRHRQLGGQGSGGTCLLDGSCSHSSAPAGWYFTDYVGSSLGHNNMQPSVVAHAYIVASA